jgi:transcription elongation factor GreA
MDVRPSPDAAASTPPTSALLGGGPANEVVLTPKGRERLETRIRELEEAAIELRAALDDTERRDEAVEALQRTNQELDELRFLLTTARSVEDAEDDGSVVEIGDTVRIRLDSGEEEEYVVVHGAEASADDRRISVESPLGRALLGHRVGETVEVAVPTGSYRCTILTASRAS